jgi:hypothetical protein
MPKTSIINITNFIGVNSPNIFVVKERLSKRCKHKKGKANRTPKIAVRWIIMNKAAIIWKTAMVPQKVSSM